MQQWLNDIWYKGSWGYIFLIPLSWIYACLISLRKKILVHFFWRQATNLCPIIIVGNITVGGTGKTPLIIWLANYLSTQGINVAILSRGYGGKSNSLQMVNKDSDPNIVGDEPVMLAHRTKCSVYVHSERFKAVQLIAEQGTDVLLLDDGLQHYKLQRDFEIAVIDGERLYGNNKLLPAGPLREPVSRLDEVDVCLTQVGVNDDALISENSIKFYLKGQFAYNLCTGDSKSLSYFCGKKVHAIAGTGNPDRFFDLLENENINVYKHSFDDHARYSPADVTFNDNLDVLMTEKDMVKCRKFANKKLWYVPVDLVFIDKQLDWLKSVDRLIATRKKNE